VKPAEQSRSNAASAGNQSQPPSSAQAAPEKAKSDRPSPASADRQAVSKAGAGADELKRAANASDSAAAAAWLWKSTAKGNPDAPVQLADMYIKGDGVPRSCEQAMVLLKTAAEKENARARNRLASLYASGNCVQRNRVEAYRWLSSALVANPHSDWAQQNKDLIWNQMTPDERVMAAKYR
jgi:TPR repeat protein